MRRKDASFPTPSPAATDELTCQGDDQQPVAAGNALQKARNFIGLGHNKKPKVSMEQKHLMALMMADTGAIETTYKDTDSQFDRLDERELAKTLGEEHLDMSVVATIVQDKDRFEKIAPQIREKIMIFILKERLKGRYFLLVDTDHLRTPSRDGVLYFKRIRRSIYYALLFLLLGIVWLRLLDGEMVVFELNEKKPNMPTTEQLKNIITTNLKEESSMYLRHVYVANLMEEKNYPECKIKFISSWTEWKSERNDIYMNNLPANCGIFQFARHRVVLIDRRPTMTKPKYSTIKCSHSHETRFSFKPCCALSTTPSTNFNEICTIRRDVSRTLSADFHNSCGSAEMLSFENATLMPNFTDEKLYVFSGYYAPFDLVSQQHAMPQNPANNKPMFSNLPLVTSNETSDCTMDAVIVYSFILDNNLNSWTPVLLCNDVDVVISFFCRFALPTAETFEEYVFNNNMPSKFGKHWDIYRQQLKYFHSKP